MNYIHLRTHTEYSIVDGILRIKDMLQKTRSCNMPAIAITDVCNLFALVKFYKRALSLGIKPIIGSELTILDSTNNLYKLVLLAQNNKGYANLTKLISRAYLERDPIKGPVINFSWLDDNELADGLIVLSGGIEGDIGQLLLSNNIPECERRLALYKQIFKDRFYLEVNRINKPDEENYISLVLDLAKKHSVPVVATNNARFLSKDDFEAHEARVCINNGFVLADPNRPKNYTEQQYLKSSEEMLELFADMPFAIANTMEIAKRCNVTLTLDKNFLPVFPTPENLTIDQYLEQQSYIGLDKRLEIIFKNIDIAEQESYVKTLKDRLTIELNVINNMGFPGYFLIVADFISWAKSNGIPVGPGRGSGAGSLVAYALGITDLNPLDYDLLFERFLNPERVSMPDFDIDFCMEGRDRVIEYVANKYGRNAVSQIITFGTMAAKAVVRDVGRVLSHSYGFVDKIAKTIPFEIGMTLDKAMQQEPALQDLYNTEDDVKEIIDLARKLEGVARNVGKHAGGVVISPGDLTNFTPIYCEQQGGSLVSQFDKDDVEAIGLVKFDFLGLRTLTIINWAVIDVNTKLAAKNKNSINIELIKLNDKATFDLLKSYKTTAIFQLESTGMKDLIKRLQPDCFEDIIALVALFRPGPLQSGMVDDFIDRKHGRAVVEYPHPALEPILKPTYGVILYQEQVMQIAQVLAGYSLGAADLLRRAMGKKKPEEMAKQREIFVTGALANNIAENTATYIFDLMEKFAGYGFNKSHSAAYALVSYQTAWLKTHFKESFMAAVLSSDMDNTDKVVLFIEECQSMHIKIYKPDVNTGFYKFIVDDNHHSILYGLGAIKGLGQAAIENIVEERQNNGKYKDLFDFCRRVDLRKVNKRSLEALIKSGALDNLGKNRAVLHANIDNAVKWAEQDSNNLLSGQVDLFALNDTQANQPQWLPGIKLSQREELQGERDILGLFFTGHPLDSYQQELKDLSVTKIRNLKIGTNHTVIVGVIMSIRRIKTRTGDRLVIITLDDKSGRLELSLFGKELESYQELIAKDKIVVAVGRVSEDRFTGGIRMQANQLMDMDEARIAKTKAIRICLTAKLLTNSDLLDNIAELLKDFTPGNCNLLIEYRNDQGRVVILPNKTWQVTVTQRLLDKLYILVPEENIKLQYNY
jgi:DNA polymerase-3 subunit alpha